MTDTITSMKAISELNESIRGYEDELGLMDPTHPEFNVVRQARSDARDQIAVYQRIIDLESLVFSLMDNNGPFGLDLDQRQLLLAMQAERQMRAPAGTVIQ